MRRFLPIVEWLPRYQRRWLRGDVAAGIAVTALNVPKNLATRVSRGVPLQNGLHAAAAGSLSTLTRPTVSHTLANIVTMQEKLTHERNGTINPP